MYHPSLDTSEYKCGTMGDSEMDDSCKLECVLSSYLCVICVLSVCYLCVICGQRKLTVGEVENNRHRSSPLSTLPIKICLSVEK